MTWLQYIWFTNIYIYNVIILWAIYQCHHCSSNNGNLPSDQVISGSGSCYQAGWGRFCFRSFGGRCYPCFVLFVLQIQTFFLGWVLMLPGYAWDSTIILMTVKTSLKRSNLRFFPADFHLGGGGLGVTQYDPLKFPNMAIFCEWGARFLGWIYPFLWGCKRSPLGAWWWVHMGDKFTSQTLGEGVIPDIPADLSGTCGSSWRTFLGCCCYHILAERYSQGKLEVFSCKKLRELTD